jgi:protein-tyrosine phosphatase
MFARLFGKKDKGQPVETDHEPATWAFLGTDMHSHFVPGIDDGAQDVEQSLFLIRSMMDMGFTQIVTTPHIMVDYYPNTNESINAGLKRLREALKANNIQLPVRAAAEYFVDDYFSNLIDTQPLLTVYQNQVLIEFSMIFEPPNINQIIFKLQGAGYRPILAHPERYPFFHRDFDKYRELKDRGCLLQMNMLAYTGYYGKGVKMAADKLLEEGVYDYLGSDMHHDKHAAAVHALLHSRAYHELKKYPFINHKITVE